MSRRYEERDRDYYQPRYEERELEVDISRQRYPARATSVVSDSRRPSGRQPDFLREDYGRTEAGPVVLARDRDRDDYSDVRSRRGPPPERVEREEVITRDRDHYSNVGSRRGGPERVERDDLVIRERERRAEPPRTREREVIRREEVVVRDREAERPTRRVDDDTRSRISRREPEREDIVFRVGEGGPPREREREFEREELVVREEARSPPRRDYRDREVDREELYVRERDIAPPRRRSLGPIAREREEFVFRRRDPSPPRDMEKEEIIIRRRERTPPREPSPEPIREPSPEPLPISLPPVIRPPIVQEIITHHRHIDHGIERVRSPSPAPVIVPPSPPPPVREDLEIEIRRRGIRNGKKFYEEEIIYDREDDRPGREMEMQITRRRSASAKSRRTEDRRDGGRKPTKDMWTEVTKDLVAREAIEEMGYEYEEKENFYYVIDYLQYEDVVQLVDLTEEIRLERKKRLKEIQWEREEMERSSKYDERIYEREVIHEGRRGGRYR